jgi:hypothetical protein
LRDWTQLHVHDNPFGGYGGSSTSALGFYLTYWTAKPAINGEFRYFRYIIG